MLTLYVVKKRGKLNILVSGTMHDEVGKSRNKWEEPSTICFFHGKGVFIAVDMVMWK